MAKHLIYLASGNSSRFGTNKLLHSYRGMPLYLHGLKTLMEVAAEDPECTLRVVSRYPQIREAARARGVIAVDCPESVQGISWSVKAGIASVGACSSEEFLLFAVADQPWLRAESVWRLLGKAVPGTMSARLCSGDTPGNPVLFSAALIPELMQLTADEGGGKIARKYHAIPVSVEDPRELMDIDQAGDLQ